MSETRQAHKIVIKSGEPIRPGQIRSTRGVRIWIDDVEINYIRNATLKLPAGNVIALELELLPSEVIVEIEHGAEIRTKHSTIELSGDEFPPTQRL